MKNYKIALLLLLSVFAACCSQQQARRPVSNSSGTFMKESAERNKKLIAGEEDKIDSIIKSEPNAKYVGSKKGYWYTYIKQSTTTDTIRPKKGDIAFFKYELKDLNGNVIYSELELRPQEYHVDKEQKIMMGLRHGIKLMKKDETVKFLIPSHMAYGYHGDNRRIGHNQPVICTVTLTDIKPENQTTTE